MPRGAKRTRREMRRLRRALAVPHERTRFLSQIVVVVFVTATLALAVRGLTRSDAIRAVSEEAVRDLQSGRLGDAEWDSAWPPLPWVQLPSRPLEQIRAAYAFAARRPEVLRYIPCFCGCQSLGHEGNLRCYLRRGSSPNRPVWDSHSLTCGVCVDITLQVMKLLDSGISVADIRATIDERYKGFMTPGTTTPYPPVHTISSHLPH